jgi:type II secretory pathway pseudopilin PulG
MTIIEVLIALGISGLTVAGIVAGYLFCINSAEQSALSLAANASALGRLEQTRSAKWDTLSWPASDELVASNFPDRVVTLDVSGSSGAITYATNVTLISQVSTNPPLRRVRVDCIWRLEETKLYTNTVETCRAPDQ